MSIQYSRGGINIQILLIKAARINVFYDKPMFKPKVKPKQLDSPLQWLAAGWVIHPTSSMLMDGTHDRLWAQIDDGSFPDIWALFMYSGRK